jgi:beta-galactosidase
MNPLQNTCLSLALISLISFNVDAQDPATVKTAREQLLLDFGWKFHLGDASSAEGDFAYGQEASFAKAGEVSPAALANFNDSTWRTVNVPHDWAVELDFVHVKDKTLHDHGFKPIGRQFPKTSIGWYRRSFNIPPSDRGKRMSVKFDGVFRDCIVWFNGEYLGRNLSGYSEFTFDITDYVLYGKKNVLVVRADATQAEGWFYEGAGVYRHTWLIKHAPLHIAQYGTYVTATVQSTEATVRIETKLSNRGDEKTSADLESIIVDQNGQKVGTTLSRALNLNGNEEKTIRQEVRISSPHLWSLETPSLYKVIQQVRSGGTIVDKTETAFGIRTVRFDKDLGFFLNGKPVKIQGVCCHQDHAGVGSALPDGLQEFRIRKLKEMGCNAYRSSHNPPTPELLEACDRLGMLVMDENRLMGSSPEFLNQFETLVLRDRNHPSVFIWSLGNEEWQIHNSEMGTNIARALKRVQQKLDPSRLCTYAANNGDHYEGVNSVVDVRGVNYIAVGDIDKYHREHPEQPLFGSEEASTLCTRGIYAVDTVNGFMSDYDVGAPSWGTVAEKWWKYASARPWYAGAFVWTGFDYRGEPTPYTWPCINSHFGIMDMCGFPKNNFYYYQSWWSNKDALHLAPHWNWRGKEGKLVDVWCQSNCDSVALFLNGKNLGTKVLERNSHLEWKVIYEPGTLEARGWRKGKQLFTKVETTGNPVAVRLVPDRSSLRGNAEDISVLSACVVDSLGREISDADNLIRFQVEGPGAILGVGNGNPSSHEPDKCEDGKYQRKLFSGKCQVIVQASRAAGTIRLTAISDGLNPTIVAIDVQNTPSRAFVGE